MKSCRCGIVYKNSKNSCLLPWGHEQEMHNSGLNYWKDSENAEKNKEKSAC